MAKSGLPMRFLSLMGILPQAFECARGNTMLRVGYRRGRIEILDRNGLKAAACECYEQYGLPTMRGKSLLCSLTSSHDCANAADQGDECEGALSKVKGKRSTRKDRGRRLHRT
jgi:hypothetical protein